MEIGLQGHFGFEKGTEYTLIPFGVGFAFSATETTLLTDGMLTLNLTAEKGYQFSRMASRYYL